MTTEDSKHRDALELLRREHSILLTMTTQLLAEKHNMPIDARVLGDVISQTVRRDVIDANKCKAAALLDDRHERAMADIAADLRAQHLPEHLIAEKLSEARQRLAANRERALEEIERVLHEYLAPTDGPATLTESSCSR